MLNIRSLCLLMYLAGGGVSHAQAPTPIQATSSDNIPIATQWANRGVELFQQEDYQGAIEYLFEAWKLDPSRSEEFAEGLSSAYSNYASKLAKNNRFKEAMQLCRKAIFFDETNRLSRQNLDILYKSQKLDPEDYQIRWQEAKKLRNDGYIEEAVAEYQKVIDLTSNKAKENLKAKLELAQIYQLLYGRYSQSPVGKIRLKKMIDLVLTINKSNPKDHRPHILLGRAYLLADMLPESIESFENALLLKEDDSASLAGLVSAWQRVVEIAPREPDNLIGYGSALIRAGKTEQGEKYLAKAKKIDPNKSTEVKDVLVSSQQINTNNQAYRYLEEAFQAQQAKDLDKAITFYEQALKILPPGPESSDVYANLGIAYEDKGMTEKALQSFGQALKLNPNNTSASAGKERIKQAQHQHKSTLTKQAISLQEKGQIQQAIASYQNILKKFPNDAETHFNLGTAYQQDNKLTLALQQYKSAASLNPDNTEYKKAADSLERAIDSGALDRVNSNKFLAEAIQLQQAGQTQQAISKYQESIVIYDRNAQAHFNLGAAMHSLGRAEEAIRSYKAAYTIDPKTYPEANYFTANLLETRDKYQEALAAYRRYIDDDSNGQYVKLAQERIKIINDYLQSLGG